MLKYPLILAAALLMTAAAHADTAATEAMSQARLAAFAKGDVETLLAQHADNAVIIAPSGVIDTPEARRALVIQTIAAFAVPDMKFTMVSATARDDLLTYVWTAETPTTDFGTGVETYVLKDGRIVYHTEYFNSKAK